MKYTVTWLPDALNELAQIWVEASNREEASRAADHFDIALSLAPWAHGESREGGSRVVFSGPLGFEYEVSEADRLVTVVSVWRIR
jgi:hypothetical protein